MFFTYNNKVEPPQEIHARSDYGLGDSIINFIFFSKIKGYIESRNIQIYYYCKERHHKNLMEFNCSQNIHIRPYRKNASYDLWQGWENLNSGKYIEDILCDMFNRFLTTYHIPIRVTEFEYNDNELLLPVIPAKAFAVDVLIINSTPTSGQFIYDKAEFNEFICKLSQKRGVAVTEFVNDSVLSLDTHSVREIASLAKTAKIVIAINTGPSIGLYNTKILNAVENVYILDTTQHYKFKTRKFTKVMRIADLEFLLSA